jgi:hypothetical protein
MLLHCLSQRQFTCHRCFLLGTFLLISGLRDVCRFLSTFFVTNWIQYISSNFHLSKHIQSLLQPHNQRRLKRNWPAELREGYWGIVFG